MECGRIYSSNQKEVSQIMRRTVIVLLLVLALAVSLSAAPKNVILLIGDGMGVAHVTAARIAAGGPGARLAMDQMPVTGFVTTYSADSYVTDSAAAATAIASGVKTANYVVGLTPDGRRTRTVLEAARDSGKKTGLVTTDAITGATPAGFAAHVTGRDQSAQIAVDLINANIDVLIGGGRSAFLPKEVPGSSRTDDKDLLAEAKSKGWQVISSAEEFNLASGSKLIALLALGALTTKDPEPPLSALTSKAISILSSGKKGFFLMVEGAQIDTSSHANNFESCVRQTLEFDKAVAAALEFAHKDRNTLVIVTADHETGGLALPADGSKIKNAWGSGGHTAVVTPIYAYGPGSDKFAGLIDNTDIARRIAELWKIKIGVIEDKN